MANYIGKVQVDGSNLSLIGSTLYGICNTGANDPNKKVTSAGNLDPEGQFINTNYNQLLKGTTIHVKFLQGNTVSSGMTLQVGTLPTAQQVLGHCVCESGTVISFTVDENEKWIVNESQDNNTTYTFAEGSTNGAFSVTPLNGTAQSVSIHGLGGAAYKAVDTSINPNNVNSENLATTAAIAQYVQDQTGGLSGLTGAMHLRGTVNSQPTNDQTSFETYISGDVVLYNDKEYVYIKEATAAASEWIELGDESSWALDDEVIHIPSGQLSGGGMIYYNGNTYVNLQAGSNGQILTMSNNSPTWTDHTIAWTNISNKPTAGTNVLGLVQTSSTVSNFTGYTAAPIDSNGVVYYRDTNTQYSASGSAAAVTSITLAYNSTTENLETVTSGSSSNSYTQLGTVSAGVLYLKQMQGATTNVITGISPTT